MFKTTGKIQVKNGIRIIGDLDIIRYYHRLIEFYTYRTEKLQLPAHGCHVTLVNPKIHKVKWELAKKYDGRGVEFICYPERMYVSRVNYWIPVDCEYGDALKKLLGVDDGPKYWGLHLTVCNRKFNGL